MERGRSGDSCEVLASSPELSVGGEGAWWTGLVAYVRGGGGAVCVLLSNGDAPSSSELTVGADGDAVDWYLQRRGGIKMTPAATRSPCGERLL